MTVHLDDDISRISQQAQSAALKNLEEYIYSDGVLLTNGAFMVLSKCLTTIW